MSTMMPLPEAAERMGVSYAWMLQLVSRKKIHGTKVRGRWYVTEDAIAEYEVSRRPVGRPRTEEEITVQHDKAGSHLTNVLKAVRAISGLIDEEGGTKPVSASVKSLEAAVIRVANRLDDAWFADMRKEWRSQGAQGNVTETSPYAGIVPAPEESESKPATAAK